MCLFIPMRLLSKVRLLTRVNGIKKLCSHCLVMLIEVFVSTQVIIKTFENKTIVGLKLQIQWKQGEGCSGSSAQLHGYVSIKLHQLYISFIASNDLS